MAKDKFMESMVKGMRTDKMAILRKDAKSQFSDVKSAAVREIARRKKAKERKGLVVMNKSHDMTKVYNDALKSFTKVAKF